MFLAAPAVAGCGSSDSGRTSGNSPGAKGNGVDLAFVDEMIRHHRMAIEMAQIAQTEGEHEAVSDLAAVIIDADMGEIEDMRQLDTKFVAAGLRPDPSIWPRPHLGKAVALRKLRRAHPFDRTFIALMRAHQETAVAMAGVELDAGRHPGVREIARKIITVQREVIAQMTQWRNVWYGAAVDAEA